MASRFCVHLLVVCLLVLGAAQSKSVALPGEPEVPKGEEPEVMQLPVGFLLGTGSSAFQVEGAWNVSEVIYTQTSTTGGGGKQVYAPLRESSVIWIGIGLGKGESVWDRFLHDRPNLQNGDVACDSYHKYKEDVTVLSDLKIPAYRFSLAWTRLLPTGKLDNVNPDGLRYYNDLIDELLAHNIEPIVTLYHLGLPMTLQEEGGWLNPKMVQYFEDYAALAFKHFGDRVRLWVTINEPHSECKWGYGGAFFAPALNKPGTADYLCGHNQILAHAAAYRLYQRHFKHQGGSVGLTVGMNEPVPKDPENPSDVQAAQRQKEFVVGWFMDPIKFGDYPVSMRSAARDRLPNFTAEERQAVTGAIDFVAINNYNAALTTSGVDSSVPDPSHDRDTNVTLGWDPSWPTGPRPNFGFSPGALRSVLRWMNNRYDNLDMYVSETGWCATADEGLDDQKRVAYFSNQIREAITAIQEDGCRVRGLMAWSFMDNLEVVDGFTLKFGVVHVNFSDPALPRTPKRSAYFLSEVASERRVPYVAWPNGRE